MIVRAADEDAALLESQVTGEFEILAAGTYPARYLGELVAEVLAHAQRLSVALTVNKELRLPDYALGSSESVQHLEQLHYLLRLIGRTALLPVAEGGVRYPDVLRRICRGQPEVEGALRHLLVGEHVTVKVCRFPILEAVFILALHKDVIFAVQLYHAAAPLQESAPIITGKMNFARV